MFVNLGMTLKPDQFLEKEITIITNTAEYTKIDGLKENRWNFIMKTKTSQQTN